MELITGNGGSVVVRASFSAYGERRDGADWSGPPPGSDLTAIANSSRRGFTGHEHLDNVGLIHMNGRVYDPRIGRFLGADPIVVAGHSQGANPYAYVWNNPLRYTDPSGYCPEVGVDCGGARHGDGWIRSPFMLEVYITLGRISSFPRIIPSASPPSAPYESPGMQVPREGMATFMPTSSGVAPILVSTGGIRIRYGAFGRMHEILVDSVHVLSFEANHSVDARERGIIDFILNSPEEVALSFGDNSWALAFWNVFVTSPVESVREFRSGDYSDAWVKAGETVFKPLKIVERIRQKVHVGKQGKHVPGHINYEPGKSILRADPDVLASRAGTGQQIGKIPVGQPGSKERVLFNDVIGDYVDEAGNAFPTRTGIIHYSKDGIHIVPGRPQ